MTADRPGPAGREAGPAGPPTAGPGSASVPGPQVEVDGCGCDPFSFDFVEAHADELDVVVEVLDDYPCVLCGLSPGTAEVRFSTAVGHARLGFVCLSCGTLRAVAHSRGVDVRTGGLGGDAPQ